MIEIIIGSIVAGATFATELFGWWSVLAASATATLVVAITKIVTRAEN